MKLAIMQPYVFPYLGYFQLIHAADKFVLYDDVNFIKQGWINRNRILLNGTDFAFSLPLEKPSSLKLISETLMHERLFKVWIDKFRKTIEQAYKKAPHFDTVCSLVFDVLTKGHRTIAELAGESIRSVCNYLKISTPIECSSTTYDNALLKSEDRVIDICVRASATEYINPVAGAKLYTSEHFLSKGLTLHFLKPGPVTYTQYDNEFIPWLSIIDVMMFTGVNDISQMLNEYEIS